MGIGRLRSMLLPSPDEILESYLTANEKLLLVDEPSTNAFIVDCVNDLLVILALLFVTLFVSSRGGGAVVAILGFVLIGILAIRLVVKRLQKWYIRYVLTDSRVLRTWGIFTRHMAFIPWSKVTDVTLKQTFAGRLFGYATVRIESANEASGFKEVRDLREPWRFYRHIAAIVEERNGKVDPPWMEDGGPPSRRPVPRRRASGPVGPT